MMKKELSPIFVVIKVIATVPACYILVRMEKSLNMIRCYSCVGMEYGTWIRSELIF